LERQLKEDGASMIKNDIISKNSKDIGIVKVRLEALSQSTQMLAKQVKEVHEDVEAHSIEHKNIESSLHQVFQDIKSLQEENKNSKELKSEIMLLKKDFGDMRKQLENVEDHIAHAKKDSEDNKKEELVWREKRALERLAEEKTSKNRFIGIIVTIVLSLVGVSITIVTFYFNFSYKREMFLKSELRNEISSVESRNEKSINRIEKSIEKIIEFIPKVGENARFNK